ncbi:PREDICTED: uncharacterized protein LOC104736626 isoform X2 [Camelina sativa]|uniref:Uncharacterized protein LOC104736626 isoform X2 n=1 Tax=Camelina sativa TaxID=90675 RepID=A0ABM1QSU8_CAMSA|nr:PREDICTED: uncharacterized protein LOC104736626 isoform X2 [Camelina sativa]
MGKTGVSSNQRTGVICMDDDWWQSRETESKTIMACHCQPPKYWDALQRICGQYDVSSEHMYDVDGARRELYEEDARADFSGGIGDGADEEDQHRRHMEIFQLHQQKKSTLVQVDIPPVLRHTVPDEEKVINEEVIHEFVQLVVEIAGTVDGINLKVQLPLHSKE